MAAQYEVHDLDHLGLPARQVTITCRHGETTRVFVRERQRRFPRDRTLLRTTAEEHQATYGCNCSQTLTQRWFRRR